MVPMERLELSHPCGYTLLKRARLPIPPHRHGPSVQRFVLPENGSGCHDERMKKGSIETLTALVLIALLSFSVLWRGGKGVEATWLLSAVAASLTIQYVLTARRATAVPLPLWVAVMLMVVWTSISFILSATRNYGFDEVLREMALALLVFWMIRTEGSDSAQSIRGVLFKGIVALTLIASAVGTIVYVLQPTTRFVGSFFYFHFSTDYWPNAWAEYLLLSWPLVLWWSLQTVSAKARTLRLLVLGWVIGTLLLSYSRGALIAFLGQQVLLILLFVPWRRRAAALSILPRLILTLFVATATFLVTNQIREQFHPVESVSKKITFTAEEGTSSFTERRQFFEQALQLSLVHPFFGWGPYSFRFVQPRLQNGVLETSDHPHNLFLKMGMERGWPAAVLLLWVLGFLFVSGMRRQHTTTQDSSSPFPYIMIGTAGVFAHNLIDFNLQFVGIALPCALLLATLCTPREDAPKARYQLIAESLVAVFLMGLLLWEVPSLVEASLGREAERAGNAQNALEWYRRAEGGFFPRDLVLSEADQYLRVSDPVSAERTLNRYLSLNSEDARAWKLLGGVETQLFRQKQALRAYEQAYILGRYNDAGITSGYLTSLQMENDQARIEQLAPSVRTVAEEFARAIQDNSHYVAISKNVERFQEWMTVASQLYPKESSEWNRLSQQAASAAQAARAQFSARPDGYLW